MFTDVPGSQWTSLSFCTIVISMMLVSSSGTAGDADILERHQEQMNVFEKLRFDGKSSKIKR